MLEVPYFPVELKSISTGGVYQGDAPNGGCGEWRQTDQKWPGFPRSRTFDYGRHLLRKGYLAYWQGELEQAEYDVERKILGDA